MVLQTAADLWLTLSDTLGPASGFSLFSPRGLHWISCQVGSTELAEFVLNQARKYMLGRSEEMVSMLQYLSPEVRAALPSKASADVAVDCKAPPCVRKRTLKLTVFIKTSSDL